MNRKIAYLVMFVSVPLVWIFIIRVSGLPSFIIPPPTLVVKVLLKETGYFIYHTKVTLTEAFLGYLLANLISVSLAISFLYCTRLEDFATPWLIFLRNIPFVTVTSILVIVMGDSVVSKLIIVVLVTYFPILANLSKGLRAVDSVLLDRMQVLNASQWQIFTRIRLPSALPYYVAAHEISFTGSIMAAIVSEWLFARKGLGYVIVYSLMQYRADQLYAATLISCFLSISAYLMVKFLENRLFAWKQDLRN